MKGPRPYRLPLFSTLLGAAALLIGLANANSSVLPWHSDSPQNSPSLATILGWVPNTHTLCHGQFTPDPPIVAETAHPKDLEEEPTHITAKGYAIIHTKGMSTIKDGIVVTQPGRRVTADTAYVFRNDKTGHIEKIILVGHVHLQEKGRTVINDRTTLYLRPQHWTIVRAAYHIQNLKTAPHENTDCDTIHSNTLEVPGSTLDSSTVSTCHPTDTLPPQDTAWGTAESASQKNKVTTFRDATFSTCNPTAPAWQLRTKTLIVDHQKNNATAYGATLRLKKIPVLYLPYLSFSLNKERKSGLLMPTPTYNNDYGFQIDQPLYWNMAPNYDMTLTTTYYQKGGVQFNDFFRFLSDRSNGFIYISEMPHDRYFADFKSSALQQYTSSTYDQYRSELESDSDNRFFASMNDHTVFSPSLSSDLILNYVTDPYYFSDFGGAANTTITNQLLNMADLHYHENHWDVTGMILAYQTLHLIDQTDLQTTSQFQRYPEFDAMARYPDIWHHLSFQSSQQIVNFVYTSDFNPDQPQGQRLHWQPAISDTITFNSGYITPMVAADSTSYWTQQLQPGLSSSANRTLPIVNIDTGLFLDAPFQTAHTHYMETFEPRLFYLYVPYENQNNLPNYNTYVIPFSFNQLYTLNQFTGLDRLENANQVSLGITTRLLNTDTNQDKLTLSGGAIYFIDQPRVCIDGSDCELYNGHWSPITGQLSYHVTPHWTLSGSTAWDPNVRQSNNSAAGIKYSSDNAHILYTGYTFTHADGFTTVGNTTYRNDSNLYTIAGAWPITKKLSAVGYLYYDLVHRRAQTYYGGLQYDTCCWALRAVAERSYTGYKLSTSNTPIYQYSQQYLITFVLKGLGNIDSGNSGQLLMSTIPGYVDQFHNPSFLS